MFDSAADVSRVASVDTTQLLVLNPTDPSRGSRPRQGTCRMAMSPAVGPRDFAPADAVASADTGTAAAPARPACLRKDRLPRTRCDSACSPFASAGLSEGATGRTSCTVMCVPFLCEGWVLPSPDATTRGSFPKFLDRFWRSMTERGREMGTGRDDVGETEQVAKPVDPVDELLVGPNRYRQI